MRSPTNADIAKGYDQVALVVVTTGAPGPMAETSKKRFEAEVAALEESGSKVTVIAPDAGSVEAFGVNLMDFTRRAVAAEAGLAQGRAAAAGIAYQRIQTAGELADALAEPPAGLELVDAVIDRAHRRTLDREITALAATL